METTPQQVEHRLLTLSAELDQAVLELEQADYNYNTAKAAAEVAMARARLDLIRDGVKRTVQERDDQAVVLCEQQNRDLAIAYATVKACRGNVERIRVQIDLARSLGTSVRSSMELL